MPDDLLNVHFNGTDEDLRSKNGVRVSLLGGILKISREGVRLDILSSRPISEMDLSPFQPLSPFLQLDGEQLFIPDVIVLFSQGQTARVECTRMDLGVPSGTLR